MMVSSVSARLSPCLRSHRPSPSATRTYRRIVSGGYCSWWRASAIDGKYCAKGPDCNRSSVDRCLNKDSINALLLSGLEAGPKSIQKMSVIMLSSAAQTARSVRVRRLNSPYSGTQHKTHYVVHYIMGHFSRVPKPTRHPRVNSPKRTRALG